VIEESEENMDRPENIGHRKWRLVGGQIVKNVHLETVCAGQFCCIHNPSDHHMRSWPMNFRIDRGFMERICPDNFIGHPDPDDPFADPLHGCDLCCVPSREES
jgi:hypothetical protein